MSAGTDGRAGAAGVHCVVDVEWGNDLGAKPCNSGPDNTCKFDTHGSGTMNAFATVPASARAAPAAEQLPILVVVAGIFWDSLMLL